MKAPLVFEIIRGSYIDGPGLRTVVFFKGCPLSCFWCHNPESRNASAELSYDRTLCAECGECESVCPTGAIMLNTPWIISSDECTLCFKCVDACNHNALKRIGKEYSIAELKEIILRDRTFYDVSNGGVTFSGGEPLMHIDYLSELLKELKKEGIHVAFETAGHFNFDAFEKKILPYTDLLLFDLKAFNREDCRSWTGVSGELILSNFKKVIQAGIKVQPRVPLVPGYTAREENLTALASFLEECGVPLHGLLCYNPPSDAKYETRNQKPDERLPSETLSPAEEERLAEFFYKNRKDEFVRSSRTNSVSW